MNNKIKLLEDQVILLKQQLAEEKQKVAYYRHIAEQTGKKSLRAIRELSQIIQETKEAKEAFRRERDFLETITKNLGAGLAVLTKDLEISWANQVLNSEIKEITGKKCYSIFKGLESPCKNCPVLNVFNDHCDQIVYEEELIAKNGKSYWFEIIITPIPSPNGKIEEVLALAVPITFRKKAEAEKQSLYAQLKEAEKMKAIGTLAGGIAHDFNNLLMAIQGYTSLLLLDLDHQPLYVEYLNGIEQLIRSGANLTKQLLAFSQDGKYEVKVCNLNQILDHTVEMFHRTKKGISLKKDYEDNLWNSEVDQSQMEQVFMNLFINAWHSMPHGGQLSLKTENVTLDEANSAHLSLSPGEYVKISVSDTGTGMDTETMKRIFEPFFTTKQMGRGSGLGLASVYGIVRNHGGYITVTSEVGVGSQFDIYIPATRKVLDECEASVNASLMRGKETILIVDDEEPVIQTTQKLLATLGYNTLTANNGKDALELINQNKGKIDLMILDMIMPEMNGEKVFELAKPLDPNLKVLLISGYSETDIARSVLDNGCHGFLEKPFSILDLSRKIREILSC